MAKSQQGFSLMEALISVIILSVGLLAILKMQLVALQASSSAVRLSIAVIRLESLHFMFACKPDNISALLAEWKQENKLYFPESKIEQTNRQIKMSWYDVFSKQTTSIAYNLRV